MSDLIDRKKALDEISKIDTSIIPSGWVKGYVDETIKETQRIIRTLPSAEPERKKGKWSNYKDEHCCSVCKCVVISGCWDDEIRYDYCPYCGAEMSEGE